MSAKIEAVKHLHAAPTSNQIEESHGLSLRHDVVIGMYIMFQCFTLGFSSKYIKYVNIINI